MIMKYPYTNYDKSQRFLIYILPALMSRNKFYIIIYTFLYIKITNCLHTIS